MDLDDTDQCPQSDTCQTCGRAGELFIATYESSVGIFCSTRCNDCYDSDRFPRLPVASVVHLVLEHCGHLGITADDMEAELARRA